MCLRQSTRFVVVQQTWISPLAPDGPKNSNKWHVHLIQRVQDGYDSIFCAGKGYRKSIRNCCSGGTKKDNCDKPPAERSGQSHEGRRPPIIFKRPPLDIITHENRPFSLDPFNVAFKGEFEELEQGDIEETIKEKTRWRRIYRLACLRFRIWLVQNESPYSRSAIAECRATSNINFLLTQHKWVIRKSVWPWHDQIDLITPNLADAT